VKLVMTRHYGEVEVDFILEPRLSSNDTLVWYNTENGNKMLVMGRKKIVED
jgi:hypothetical protein